MAVVRDIMTKEFVTLTPEMSIERAIDVLLEHQISGAPVVNDRGQLVGFVSELRLLEIIYDPAVSNTRIADVMTKSVLTVRDDAIVSDATSLIIANRFSCLPVICNERVVGVVSRCDILRYATTMANSDERILCTAASFCDRMSRSAENAARSEC